MGLLIHLCLLLYNALKFVSFFSAFSRPVAVSKFGRRLVCFTPLFKQNCLIFLLVKAVPVSARKIFGNPFKQKFSSINFVTMSVF